MSIRKIGNRWVVDIDAPGSGRRKRIRKRFHTKPEAIRFEAFVRNQATQGKAWNPISTDRRTFKDLIETWYRLHGHNLKDGAARQSKLMNLAMAMGDPQADAVTAKLFIETRARRMAGDKPISANTANHDLAYAKAVFNELKSLDEWQHENPLSNVKKLTHQDPDLIYLDIDQVRELLEVLKKIPNRDPYIVALICLATGARWGEAENLKRSQVNNGQIMLQSKNGRPMWIPYECADIDAHIDGRRGQLFAPCSHLFRTAIDRTSIELPAGQLTHVLRHTFASTFMIQGGDIITLQKILRHTTLAMTVRYAHLAPGHLADAPKRSPLALL